LQLALSERHVAQKVLVRALSGLVCPGCRYHEGAIRLYAEGITRCPHDGLALVEPNVLADADGDPFLGTNVAGRCVILGKIGVGAMGTVYRARDELGDRDVAVKIFRGDRGLGARARLEREAKALSMLRSPHTVAVFGAGEIVPRVGDDLVEPSPCLYLVMEMLEGESLASRLRRVGRLQAKEAARIATHALASLSEAHDKGIVHRDVKPANVFLTRAQGGGEIGKLLDFGLARLDHEQGRDALGEVLGTPRYMSPEQARGEPIDARSDLYSLGVLLHHTLVGRPPFTDRDAMRVMARHVHEAPIPPCEAAADADIPRALSDLVVKALRKRPEERPKDARSFIAALAEAVGVEDLS